MKEVKNNDIISNKIILRCVYGKGPVLTLQPCKNPATKRFPPCVRSINKDGDILLSEDERKLENSGQAHYIAENAQFKIEDNTTFDLSDVCQAAEWEAIKYSSFIAESRDAKDSKGNFIIDGDVKGNKGIRTSGQAEFYIDIPGKAATTSVSKIKEVHKAVGFILGDERGYEGWLLKARLLGRVMSNQPSEVVQQFLLQKAQKDPKSIIQLYTGTDIQLRLLFLDAKDKHVIVYKDKVYMYGENIIAPTDDAVILWMQQPKNAGLLSFIKRDTYPDYEPKK